MPGTAVLTTEPVAPTVDAATAIASALFDHMAEAWNRADGAGFGEVYDGRRHLRRHPRRPASWRGRDRGGHQAIFDTIYAGSTVRYDVEQARLVAPGCIVANVAAVLDVPGGPFAGIRHARITGTIVRQGDGWAVAAFHNTLVEEAR